MRFSIIILLASAVSGMASYPRQNLPTCAITCIQDSAAGTGCSSTDEACLCKSSAFIESTSACFQTACTASELSTAVQAAEAICKNLGVTLNTSLSATSGSTAAMSASSTSTASKSASSSTSGNGGSAFSISLTPLALVGVVMAIII